MCLAVPGKILAIEGDDSFSREGTIAFAGMRKRISLAYTPAAQVNDYVLVHAGFAIEKVDEEEAERLLGFLRDMGELDELETGEA